jgi:hypothetical protein
VESAHLTQGCGGLVAVDGFVFDWCVHSDTGVASLTVVEDLKVFEDRVGGLDTRLPSSIGDTPCAATQAARRSPEL